MNKYLPISIFRVCFVIGGIAFFANADAADEWGKCRKQVCGKIAAIGKHCKSPIIMLTDEQFRSWIARPKGWCSGESVAVADGNPRALQIKPGKGILVSGPRGSAGNLISHSEFGDVQGHFEFMIPRKSNSGIYFMGRYELQIFDSFGVEKPEIYDCGAIYARGSGKNKYEGHPPLVNASRPVGQWQSFDFIFRAPRFDRNGKKTANARFELVCHNGKVVQKNVQVTGPTCGAIFEDEKPSGPLLVQGDHGPVAYRNCWVRSIPISARKRAKVAAEAAKPLNSPKSTK